jgi:hypothetical protein
MTPDIESTDLGPHKNRAIILAKSLIKDAGVLTAPVSLRQIMEHLQKSRDVTLLRVTDFSEKISGLLVVCAEVDKDYAVIGYNDKHPWCRRRFTIGHEIGHLLMGQACNQRPEDQSHDETEANLFSSELLMPAEFIKKDFKKSPDIPALARQYLVSAEAMSYRLMRAKLLRK